MKQVRAFLALDAPAELRAKVGWIRDRYLNWSREQGREENRSLRWSAGRNLHLTVQFIGDVGWTEAGRIALDYSKRISRRKSGPFNVVYKGFDCFDRVLFMKLYEGEEQLQRLQDEFRRTLSTGGVAYDSKSFKGHLTLARSRRSLRRGDTRKIVRGFLPELSFSSRAEKLTLYESRLGPKGPTYLPIKEFYLD